LNDTPGNSTETWHLTRAVLAPPWIRSCVSRGHLAKQYLVVDRDETVFENAGDWAGLSTRRPTMAEPTMMAYSMSKTITAAAVLRLVEAQKVVFGGRSNGLCSSSWQSGALVSK
jgi:hypothetical protein